MSKIKQMETWLHEEGFDCGFEEIPIPRLLVHLGADPKNRERILEVVENSQEFGTFIQFKVLLPFSVTSQTASNVAHLLLFLNSMIELPGFEMNEIEEEVSFRHVLISKDLDKTLFLGIIGMILLFLDLFSDSIERVASGKNSFNDLLEEIVQAQAK